MQKNHIIVKRRLNLYLDFIINITYKIHTTHPGFDCLYDDNDIKNHFNWCYNSICKEFMEQNVDFYKNKKIRETLFEFFYKKLYTINKMESLSTYLIMWNNVFSDRSPKNVAMMYTLYENFDKAIV